MEPSSGGWTSTKVSENFSDVWRRAPLVRGRSNATHPKKETTIRSQTQEEWKASQIDTAIANAQANMAETIRAFMEGAYDQQEGGDE